MTTTLPASGSRSNSSTRPETGSATTATSAVSTAAELAGCCRPSTTAPLDLDTAQRIAGVLKALAEPARLRLLSLVAGDPAGEVCLCDLTGPVGLSQPTVSHHMKVLVDAGIVDRDVRGRWSYYRLIPGAVDTVAGLLISLAR